MQQGREQEGRYRAFLMSRAHASVSCTPGRSGDSYSCLRLCQTLGVTHA